MTYHEMAANIREAQAQVAREKERETFPWLQHLEVSPKRLWWDGTYKTYDNNQQQGDNAMNTKKVVCECEVVEEVPEFLSANISPTANGFKLTVHDTKFNNEEYSYESLASALAGLGHAIEEFDQEQGEEG